MRDAFDCPLQETWDKRRDWLYQELEKAETGMSYLLSEHAVALFMDMQLAYCAGAWLSVIVMSVSVIDAHLRETEALDNKIGTAKLLSDYYNGGDIDWLRKLRNKYVHVDLDKSPFAMNDWYSQQEKLEEDATTAMQMTIAAIFQSPGT